MAGPQQPASRQDKKLRLEDAINATKARKGSHGERPVTIGLESKQHLHRRVFELPKRLAVSSCSCPDIQPKNIHTVIETTWWISWKLENSQP